MEENKIFWDVLNIRERGNSSETIEQPDRDAPIYKDYYHQVDGEPIMISEVIMLEKLNALLLNAIVLPRTYNEYPGEIWRQEPCFTYGKVSIEFSDLEDREKFLVLFNEINSVNVPLGLKRVFNVHLNHLMFESDLESGGWGLCSIETEEMSSTHTIFLNIHLHERKLDIDRRRAGGDFRDRTEERANKVNYNIILAIESIHKKFIGIMNYDHTKDDEYIAGSYPYKIPPAGVDLGKDTYDGRMFIEFLNSRLKEFKQKAGRNLCDIETEDEWGILEKANYLKTALQKVSHGNYQSYCGHINDKLDDLVLHLNRLAQNYVKYRQREPGFRFDAGHLNYYRLEEEKIVFCPSFETENLDDFYPCSVRVDDTHVKISSIAFKYIKMYSEIINSHPDVVAFNKEINHKDHMYHLNGNMTLESFRQLTQEEYGLNQSRYKDDGRTDRDDLTLDIPGFALPVNLKSAECMLLPILKQLFSINKVSKNVEYYADSGSMKSIHIKYRKPYDRRYDSSRDKDLMGKPVMIPLLKHLEWLRVNTNILIGFYITHYDKVEKETVTKRFVVDSFRCADDWETFELTLTSTSHLKMFSEW